MTQLLHVDPDEYLVDAFRLGRKVYLSGFRPKHVISIWRGGTPVGLGVDTYFRSRGLLLNHTTIATHSYVGIAQQSEVIVKNLEHLVQVVCPEDGLLIVDDVYESGNTIRRVVEHLRRQARANAPRQIVVAALHHKPERCAYAELPVISIHCVDKDVWIDYPHELADLVNPGDPEDRLLREKSEAIWSILRSGPTTPSDLSPENDFYYIRPTQLLQDCIRLGVNIASDAEFRPDFMIALWPGGIFSGLPVHEVYKYFQRKSGKEEKAPDHISVNTSPTRQSYRHQVIGLHYLEEHINKDDNILIIDTTFRAGRAVNDVVMRLKEALRRNLNHKRIRVASVFYNPDDKSTWTVRPDIKKPDYYLRLIRKEVVYPFSVHKLPDPRQDLKQLFPELWDVLYRD